MSPSALTARLKALQIEWFAITDHNSMANCPAYEAVANKAGISFSWGVEIQTLEEIHLLAYFDNREMALAFDSELDKSLLPIENDPEYFGDQVIIDENENILRVESIALINSSSWDLATATEQVLAHNGLPVPAHVDAEVNSVLSQLGFFPVYPEFELLGITATLDMNSFLLQHPEMVQKAFLRASDAHYLSDLKPGLCKVNAKQATVSELLAAARKQDGRFIDFYT